MSGIEGDKKSGESPKKASNEQTKNGVCRNIFRIIREIYEDILNSTNESSKFQRPPTG